MRWAAKAGSSKLDWSILDVEQEEWERQLANLDVAAANGFPVYPAAAVAKMVGGRAAVTPQSRSVHRLLPALALLAVLLGVAAAVVGYSVWRTAQAGVVRMKGDVANAVKLESLHERSQERTQPSQTQVPIAAKLAQGPVQVSVHTVEFLDGAAMATVFVTQTQRAGEFVVVPELRFYTLRAKGWQRSAPIASFWGPTATLDTAHLHFVFGSRDRAVVVAAAPGAEATYVLLHRATGVDLVPEGPATIEIVPRSFLYTEQLDDGRLRLSSPALYRVPAQERVAMLNRLLHLALVRQLMAVAAQKSPAKAQWQPLVQALGSWLEFTTAIGFAPDDEAAALRRLVLSPLQSAWHLADLQEDVLCCDPAAQGMVVSALAYNAERRRQQAAASVQLIDYIATHYGIDVLSKLLVGFEQYENWEELAPAVLGVNAAKLEEAWHGGG